MKKPKYACGKCKEVFPDKVQLGFHTKQTQCDPTSYIIVDDFQDPTPLIPVVENTEVNESENIIRQALKYDENKPDLSMISQELLVKLARVREFGAKKYTRNNWRNGFKFSRSIAAAMRHLCAFNEGEDLDPESSISHVGHAIACLEHLLNDIKNHPENDDRYKKS